jgi:hypothetical protein
MLHSKLDMDNHRIVYVLDFFDFTIQMLDLIFHFLIYR